MVLVLSKTPNINIVKVIRKKKVYNGEQSWWAPKLETDKYYSSILNEKHYIYSFLNSYAARNCYSFLHKFKEVNKKYPENIINTKENVKENNENVQPNCIYIEDESLEKLKRQCALNGIYLLGISKFEYTYEESGYLKKNIFNITMEASELKTDKEFSYIDQINNLNYLLDLQ